MCVWLVFTLCHVGVWLVFTLCHVGVWLSVHPASCGCEAQVLEWQHELCDLEWDVNVEVIGPCSRIDCSLSLCLKKTLNYICVYILSLAS